MCIPDENESQWNEHSHREWKCASPGMGMCLTGNANSLYRVRVVCVVKLNINSDKAAVALHMEFAFMCLYYNRRKAIIYNPKHFLVEVLVKPWERD